MLWFSINYWSEVKSQTFKYILLKIVLRMTNLTYDDLKLPTYLNNSVVGNVGGTSLTIVDAINAAQISGLKIFAGGKKGSGKSQLLADLYFNRFGGEGIYEEGRLDFTIDEIFKKINLKKLREGLSSEELIELTEKINYVFVGFDEINRCPEPIQNFILGLMNGVIEYNDEPITLGR